MAAQKQDDQHERTFSSYVRIQVVVLKTYLGRWTIGRSGERGSGISVLPARYDDDDDFIYQFIHLFFRKWGIAKATSISSVFLLLSVLYNVIRQKCGLLRFQLVNVRCDYFQAHYDLGSTCPCSYIRKTFFFNSLFLRRRKMFSVTVTVEGNGIEEPSSNLGEIFLYFTAGKCYWEKNGFIFPPLDMGKIVGQTR